MSLFAQYEPMKGGLLEQMLDKVVIAREPFTVESAGLTFRFRCVVNYSEFSAMWDRAIQWEALVTKQGSSPRVAMRDFPMELQPKRAGVATQAHWLSQLSLDPEMQDPLAWLAMAKQAGLAFKDICEKVEFETSIKIRKAEDDEIDEKKDSSDVTSDIETD